MYEAHRSNLSAMLGTYPKTEPLKRKSVTSPQFDLEFAPVDVATKAFKMIVRELKYDVAEIAIVTFLQAFAAGKPYVLLPFVMNGGFHHKSIFCRADDPLKAEDLSGRRIAMRAYTQTTPTWVRGILCDDYGMRLESVRWFSQEGAHVADYVDPPWVTQLDAAKSLEQMLMAGEVDAIIAGSGMSGNPEIRSLIPDAKQAALAWYARHHAVPINHLVSMRKELAEARPDVVCELFRMLKESRRLGDDRAPPDGIDLQPVGFEAIRPALETIVRFSFEQRLIPQIYPIESLFGTVLKAIA